MMKTKVLLVFALCMTVYFSMIAQKHTSVILSNYKSSPLIDLQYTVQEPSFTISFLSQNNFPISLKASNIRIKSNLAYQAEDSYLKYSDLKNLHLAVDFNKQLNVNYISDYWKRRDHDLGKDVLYFGLGALLSLGMMECVADGKFRSYDFPIFMDKEDFKNDENKRFLNQNK